jgi:hypothetical protein
MAITVAVGPEGCLGIQGEAKRCRLMAYGATVGAADKGD